ncbi:MAG: phosphoribosylpyrophosphate synthetase, partial [Pseudomonadota bacterium]
NIRIVPVAPLFAQSIINVTHDTSVSSLFVEDLLGPLYESLYGLD